jgi:hypothetical protein
MRLQLPYGFKTPSDIFKKLQRDANRLNTEINPDNIFSFIVTAHSLADWVKTAIGQDTSKMAELDELREEDVIRICRDIANASKHFELDLTRPEYKKHPVLAQAVIFVEPARFGTATFGTATFGGGVGVQTNNGQYYKLGELKDEVIRLYDEFLSRHGLA